MKVIPHARRLTMLAALSALLLGGCASENSATVLQEENMAVPALGNMEYHTYVLANELFANLRPSRQAKYAVVGFVPADSMEYNPNNQDPLMMLSHQLEEGLITEATKRGYTTQEFKLTDDIIMGERADRVLTRDVDLLPGIERVDFYITGTVIRQQSGAMVNARVINARTKDVVAAATRFFPEGLFWDEEKVTTRNGRLYRNEDKG
ncbi:FlgO family outer membrane protein [Alteromonas confluentis]|uniref:FlgO domain-containing protein n=1 Tax=Alteromonas confluentis TaxID=1656094 RepID=A0A1E7ZBT7_9ALTE|nr:FlgO family outer membrane protein [Alteromonas confluentis]OFC70985.1 hypothetical protein BFC18_11155 [Alteromonas confluentis]